MKTTLRRIMVIVMAMAIVMTAMNPVTAEAAAKKQVKLNKTKTTLTITNKKTAPTVTLKVQNTKKTVKWSTSSKKIATVKKIDKYSAKVTAKKAGTARITAKVGGRKYTCTVTVKDTRGKANNNDTAEDDDDIEMAIGIYMCNCGYAWIPVFKSSLGRSAELAHGDECTAEEWNVHMAEHRKNGESTDYKDTTKGPKPLGVRTCQCGYRMLGYHYAGTPEYNAEENAIWDAHQDWHRERHDRAEDYNYDCRSYKAFMDCLWK